jgi:HK97 family phage portal protein
MAIVSSFGAMQALTSTRNQSWWGGGEVGGSVNLGDTFSTYAWIYRTQPNVRICVDFLARNIAQLDVHAFRRLSDDDRERLADHDVERWLGDPNPGRCEFRLIEDAVSDLGIYLNAFWVKLRPPTERKRVGLLRIPPEQMSVSGGLLPSLYTWTLQDGTEKDFAPADIVHFGGYNPDDSLIGLSPMETLKQTLSEVYAAARNREDFWNNGSRFYGIIERPKDAPKWDKIQRQGFGESWNAQYGPRGAKRGGTPILEDGMTFKSITANAKDSEYIASLKLSREICAAAYHIPLPLVGILEHATFSNIKEQHKHLYQDCLGPWLKMITQELQRQLLPESSDRDRVYLEFNIAEKMKGSFEEQAAALNVAVGRPWMTVNEARARMNMRRSADPEADKLAVQPGTGDAQIKQGEIVEEEPPPRRQLEEAAAVQYQRLQAQIVALASRPTIINVVTQARPPMQRTFARDETSGVITSFTDSATE